MLFQFVVIVSRKQKIITIKHLYGDIDHDPGELVTILPVTTQSCAIVTMVYKCFGQFVVIVSRKQL